MREFSNYEEKMIGFLMGHGLSAEDAEQSVIDERLDRLGDANKQLTEENQRTLFGSSVRTARLIPIPNDPEAYRKVMAFRVHIGEDVWRVLGGNAANERLIAMAIDFSYKHQ